eukprot:358855-Chlamydomonas_euryale.AAC.10
MTLAGFGTKVAGRWCVGGFRGEGGVREVRREKGQGSLHAGIDIRVEAAQHMATRIGAWRGRGQGDAREGPGGEGGGEPMFGAR